MNVLPIVERELRVQSRRPSTYWWRTGLVMIGALTVLPFIALAESPMQPSITGSYVLSMAGGWVFVLCLGMGLLLAADAVSRERREGTLGLLFLTDLRGHDVVLGKLASCGLQALYGVVAILPLLSWSLLLGGVTAGEFVRVSLVLVQAAFLGLAVGLLASSCHVKQGRALLWAFASVGILVLGPLLLDIVANPTMLLGSGSGREGPPLDMLSLAGVLTRAFSTSYGPSPWAYWVGLAFNHVLAWGCLWRASALVRRLEGGEVGAAPRAGAAVWEAGGAGAESLGQTGSGEGIAFDSKQTSAPDLGQRRRLYEQNPAVGMIDEPKGATLLLQIAAVLHLAACVPRAMGVSTWSLGMHDALTIMLYLVTSAVGLGRTMLVAWIAASFLCQLRRREALELILVTPVTAEQLLQAHWRSVYAWVRTPLAIILTVDVVRGLAMFLSFPLWGSVFFLIVEVLGGAAFFIASNVGLVLVATRLSLQMRSVLGTAVVASLLVAWMPALVRAVVQLLLLVGPSNWGGGGWFEAFVWLLLSVGTVLILAVWARRDLGRNLRARLVENMIGG